MPTKRLRGLAAVGDPAVPDIEVFAMSEDGKDVSGRGKLRVLTGDRFLALTESNFEGLLEVNSLQKSNRTIYVH